MEDKMETDESAVKDDVPKEGEKDNAPAEGLKKKLEKEKVGYEIENMSRVLPAQLKYLTFPDLRYEPVKRPTGGVILVIDTQPEAERETLELKASKVEAKPAPSAPSGPESTGQDRVNEAPAPHTPVSAGSGAAAAAGVLTAVDEDEEGAEEAPLPNEFEYFSENEDKADEE
jgi:26S proteasome regulatory subunit N2